MTSLKFLKNFVKSRFPNSKIVIASKSEPYRHKFFRGEIKVNKGADGLVAALDPVMQAVDGVWVAAGLADADFEVTDAKGRVRVPEDSKRYTLKRIGFSENEKNSMRNVAPGGFWPLCHVTFVPFIFDSVDWQEYKSINHKIAEAILEELEETDGVVWLHDYHLVMCAKYLKEKRPDLTVGLFWHVPFPDWEVFVRHPKADEVIDGLLANDLLGFHTKYYCNNFIRCCQRIAETKVNEGFTDVTCASHTTRVLPFPISIDFSRFDRLSSNVHNSYIESIKEKYWLKDKIIAFSAERFVYTKGIKEKMMAVDRLLQRRPELIGKFTLFDVTAFEGSHAGLEAGKRYHTECINLMYEINEKYETDEYKPIVLTEFFVKPKELITLYKISDIGFITPLHDGMNLVAKEYVASKPDLDGVLILSKFAGAAEEMKEAVQVNPFSVDELTNALEQALDMSDEERRWKMGVLRHRIQSNNVFHWAKNFFTELAVIEGERQL